MTKDRLLDLLKKKITTKDAFDRWSLANVAGKTPEELLEIDLGLARARNAWVLAASEYEMALRAFQE